MHQPTTHSPFARSISTQLAMLLPGGRCPVAMPIRTRKPAGGDAMMYAKPQAGLYSHTHVVRSSDEPLIR